MVEDTTGGQVLLAVLRGVSAKEAPLPLWVQFLLFSCSFGEKLGQTIGRRPHIGGWCPVPVWKILDPPLYVISTHCKESKGSILILERYRCSVGIVINLRNFTDVHLLQVARVRFVTWWSGGTDTTYPGTADGEDSGIHLATSAADADRNVAPSRIYCTDYWYDGLLLRNRNRFNGS